LQKVALLSGQAFYVLATWDIRSEKGALRAIS